MKSDKDFASGKGSPEPDKTNVTGEAPADSPPPAEGGVNISGGNVRVTGDLVAGDKTSIGTQILTGSLRVFNVDIRLLPVVIVLVIIIAALGYYILRPTKPEKMTGEFNVAIANFSVLDENGKPLDSADGRKLADFIALRLKDSFDELNLKNIQYELWGPDLTGTVPGSDSTQREKAAKELAEKIGAHIVIYGAIQKTRRGFEFPPEFYVNYKGFTEAGDFTGEHDLGAPLALKLPFASNQIQDVENPALSARATALSLITIGLAYYSIDDYGKALDYFKDALGTDGWLDTAGKEVGYLLLGNALVRLASKEKTTTRLQDAIDAYEQALLIDADYARAEVGHAGTLYLIALGDPNNPSFETVELTKLDEAEKEFQTALTEPNTPESANIPAKVHLGMGQIYFVRFAKGDAGALAQAKNEFEQVISEYNGGNQSIAELTAFSYARLALIARVQNDAPTAIENYKKAIELASPFYEATYQGNLGDVYSTTKQYELAATAFEDALNIANRLGDAGSARKYQQRLDAAKAAR